MPANSVDFILTDPPYLVKLSRPRWTHDSERCRWELAQTCDGRSASRTVFKPLTDRYLGVETVLFMRRDQRYSDLKDLVDDLLSRLLALKIEIN